MLSVIESNVAIICGTYQRPINRSYQLIRFGWSANLPTLPYATYGSWISWRITEGDQGIVLWNRMHHASPPPERNESQEMDPVSSPLARNESQEMDHASPLPERNELQETNPASPSPERNELQEMHHASPPPEGNESQEMHSAPSPPERNELQETHPASSPPERHELDEYVRNSWHWFDVLRAVKHTVQTFDRSTSSI